MEKKKKDQIAKMEIEHQVRHGRYRLLLGRRVVASSVSDSIEEHELFSSIARCWNYHDGLVEALENLMSATLRSEPKAWPDACEIAAKTLAAATK